MPTLWSRGEIIGHTGIQFAGEANLRSWQLIPTADFDKIRPTVTAFLTAQGIETSLPLIDVDPNSTKEQAVAAIQAFLDEHPEVRRRLEVYRAFTDLQLELRDKDGQPMPAGFVTIGELPLTAADVASAGNHLAEMGLVGSPPYYMVVLTGTESP